MAFDSERDATLRVPDHFKGRPNGLFLEYHLVVKGTVGVRSTLTRMSDDPVSM